MKTVLIVVNPRAGDGSRRRRVAELSEELKRHGLIARQITSLDRLAEEARALQEAGELRAVIAAGGDGTIAEVANRIGRGAPLGIFPLGTENLLAGYLGLNHDCTDFARCVAEGRTTWLDAGRANGRIFLLMAGIGFDAEVVRRLHDVRTGNIRHLSYAKPIWQAIRNYNYPELRVSCARQGEAWGEPIRCRWAFVSNVPRYGMGLQLAPAASPADGELDLCTFERGGFMAGLRYLIAVMRSRHQELAGCCTQRGQKLRIEADAEVPYELDGDPGGVLPLEIESLPSQFQIIVSPTWSLADLER
jgi:YegS/Rv2252/BmrU family lipid kinase